MGRDRWIIMAGVGVFAFFLFYMYSRLLSGTLQIPDPRDRLANVDHGFSPSRLQAVMKEMAALEQAIREDAELLSPDDAIPIHYNALMMAALVDSLKKETPREVSKGSLKDWSAMLDDAMAAGRQLAGATADPEEAEEPEVVSGIKRLRTSCLVCHEAFGLPPEGSKAQSRSR